MERLVWTTTREVVSIEIVVCFAIVCLPAFASADSHTAGSRRGSPYRPREKF